MRRIECALGVLSGCVIVLALAYAELPGSTTCNTVGSGGSTVHCETTPGLYGSLFGTVVEPIALLAAAASIAIFSCVHARAPTLWAYRTLFVATAVTWLFAILSLPSIGMLLLPGSVLAAATVVLASQKRPEKE